jgi:uncharacterized glyoxalase superfamily protein PhnB
MTPDSPAATSDGERAEPEAFHALTLSVSLTVRDIWKSLAWYHDVVGFAIDRKYERDGKLMSVALRAGDERILIGQDDGASGWDRVKGEGFSLYFTTGQSVDEIAARIKRLGGTLESEPADTPWGVRVFRVKDPDGFKIAISSAPAA